MIYSVLEGLASLDVSGLVEDSGSDDVDGLRVAPMVSAHFLVFKVRRDESGSNSGL